MQDKKAYEKPRLLHHGSVEERTLQTPGGNIKGGGECFHLDKFGEESSTACS